MNVYLLYPGYLPPSQQELNCYHQESFVSAGFVLDSNVKTEQAYEKSVRSKEGLAQSVERLTAEQEVAGSIPGAGPILRVLK